MDGPMGNRKDLWWALVGIWAWLLCDPAVGAAIPGTTESSVTEDDFTSTVLVPLEDYFDPTMPAATEEEELAVTVQSTLPVDTKGTFGEAADAVVKELLTGPLETTDSELTSNIHDVDSVTNTPTETGVTLPSEDLKETPEFHLAEKKLLTQANSSDPSLEKGAIKRDPEVDSRELATAVVLLSKETFTPSWHQQAAEVITNPFSGVTDPPVTPFATSDEELLASPSGGKGLDAVSSEGSSEDLNQGGPLNFTPATEEESEAVTLEPMEDILEHASNKLVDPSSNPILPGETLANGDSPSLSPEDSAVTSNQKPSSGLLSHIDAFLDKILDRGSLQSSPSSLANLGIKSGLTGGRGDADMTPSSSGPELSQAGTTKVGLEEAEVPKDDEASNSSPSFGTTDVPSDSVSHHEAPIGFSTLPLVATGVPPVGFSEASGISSRLPEDSEPEAASKTEEIEEGPGNLDNSEGSFFSPPLPAQGTETPGGEGVSADTHSGATSSLNPGVETTSSELEDMEPVAITNSPLQGKINPTSSNSVAVTEKESETLLDIKLTSPPPVDNEGAGKALATSAETSSLGPPNGSSSERGEEVLPNGSPGNIGSSSEDNEAVPSILSISDTNELDTPGNSEDQSGTKLPPSEREFVSISSTPLPIKRSGALDDGLSPTQSLEENAQTSISSSSLEGRLNLPSKSAGEALSETDITALSSNPFPGLPPPSPKNPEHDMEAGSVEPEDSGVLRGEDTSSAVPVLTPQPALSGMEATEESRDSEDIGNGATLPPKKEGTGVTSEPPVNEKPISESDNVQDKNNSLSSEPQLVSEDATDASAVIPAGQSETISPVLADTETSTKAQVLSGETSSSASSDGTLSGSEKESGEPSPAQPSKNPDFSQNSEVAEGSGDENISTGLAAADTIDVTIGDKGLLGNYLPVPDTELGPTKVTEVPVGQLATSSMGEKPAGAPIEDGETFVTNTTSREESPSSPLNAKPSPFLASDLSRVQPSGSSASPSSSELSPDPALKVEPTAPSLDLKDLAGKTGKEDTDLLPSAPALLSSEGAETAVSPSAPREGAKLSPDFPLNEGVASSEEGGESAKSESGTDTGPPQPSPEEASTAEVQGSGAKAVEESELPGSSDAKEISGGLSEGKTSLTGSIGTGSSEEATKPGSLPLPDGASIAEGAEVSDLSGDVAGKGGSLSPSTSGSPPSTANGGSQLPADGASQVGLPASDGVKKTDGNSVVSGEETLLVPSTTEVQLPETSTNQKESGGLENGEASLPTGSQPSPDTLAAEGTIASEGAELSKDNSVASGKETSIGSQSPEASVNKEVSEKPGSGESALFTDGRKDTANIGSSPAGAQTSSSSTETGLNQENTAEHLGEKSDSVSGGDFSPQTSSVDEARAKIPNPSGGNLISSSLSTNGNLDTKETSQDSGSTDSSQPPSESDFENPADTGKAEHPLLPVSGPSVLSNSDTSGGSDSLSPDAHPGAEISPGGSGRGTESEVLKSVGGSSPPSAEGTKPEASPALPSSPNNVLPLGSSDSGAANPEHGAAGGLSPSGLPGSSGGLDTKNGEGSSPTAPEGRGDTAQKETSTASTSGKAQPSLVETKLSPAGAPPPLPETKPQVKGDSTSLPPKAEVPASSGHPLPGKLLPSVPAAPVAPSTSAQGTRAEQLQAFIKSKIAFGLSKANLSRAKLDVLLAKKASKIASIKAGKKSDSDSKESESEESDENTSQLGMTSAPSGEAASLFPYGADVNDKEYVERKVDFNSPLFEPEIGVPLGYELRKSLYFTDNGQIIFPASNKDITSYPNPPLHGFNGREKVPMIAVFWDNADFSQGTGTIFYQEYISQNSPKHQLVQDVEAKIRQYVKSSYSARWTLKVTWVKAQPYPAQRKNIKTNTYQAILTTDGYRTYTLFLYQDGGMLWDPAKLSTTNVLIGYTSGDGYFRNDHLMEKTAAEKYRPDHFQGYNTDLRGLWIYKLDSRIRVNYRQRCLDWISHEGLPSAWNKALPPCPCSLQQAVADNHYVRSKKGSQDSSVTLLYSASPNQFGAGVRCLYNQKNQLVEGRQERIWKDSRKNSLNNDEELKFYDWCCNQAESPQLCNKYSQKRPKIGCQGYQTPVQVEKSSEEKSRRKRRG